MVYTHTIHHLAPFWSHCECKLFWCDIANGQTYRGNVSFPCSHSRTYKMLAGDEWFKQTGVATRVSGSASFAVFNVERTIVNMHEEQVYIYIYLIYYMCRFNRIYIQIYIYIFIYIYTNLCTRWPIGEGTFRHCNAQSHKLCTCKGRQSGPFLAAVMPQNGQDVWARYIATWISAYEQMNLGR